MQAAVRSRLMLALCAMVVLCTGCVRAQTFPDWVTPTAQTIGSSDVAQKRRLIGATAFLAPVSQVVLSAEPGYYRLNSPPGGFDAIAGTPVAPTTQFYGEPRMSANGRTGYLVAPDIVATASHGHFDADLFAVVFNMYPHYDAETGNWASPDFDRIPAANVIFPPHAGVLVDSLSNIPAGVDPNGDYAAFRLAAQAADRAFVRLRRTGNPEAGDRFMLASHPERMVLKVSKNVGFLGMAPLAGTTLPTFTNYGLMDGSSGGPMFNLTAGYVEVAVGGPNAFGCVMLTFDAQLGYSTVSNICPESPAYLMNGVHGPAWPAYNVLDFRTAKSLAQHLVPVELLVAPLGTVTQALALGAPVPTPNFSYTLAAAAGAPAAIEWSAAVDPPAAGQPAFLSMAAATGTLAPGDTLTKTATLSTAGITACGVYEQALAFDDVSHGFSDRIRHRLEVGVTDYAITAPASNRFQGIASPYLPAQIQYTIRNPRPTATQVRVVNDTNWLRIDGQGVPGSGSLDVTYDLAANGSPGDSAIVTVTLDATAADALSIAEHSADLTFTNLGACPNPGAAATRTQAVVLDRREFALTQDIVALVPEAAVATPLVGTIDVPAAFCVANIEVRAGFLEQGGFGNAAFAVWKGDLDLYLTNPTGQRVHIWDRGAVPSNWPYDSELYDGSPTQIIRLNRTDRLPPSGVTLDAFVNRAAVGTWTLEAVDQVVNGRLGFETIWQLKLKGTPGACPP